jgi:hypothetical protein
MKIKQIKLDFMGTGLYFYKCNTRDCPAYILLHKELCSRCFEPNAYVDNSLTVDENQEKLLVQKIKEFNPQQDHEEVAIPAEMAEE